MAYIAAASEARARFGGSRVTGRQDEPAMRRHLVRSDRHDPPVCRGTLARANVEATEGQAHYLGGVMRRAVGDPVHLFNGRDGEWAAASPPCRAARRPSPWRPWCGRKAGMPICGWCSPC